MRARVRFGVENGPEVELEAGDLIGRMPSAALRLDDGRISEAHAIVTLRKGQLQLLPLRGRIAVDGKPRTKVVLEPGLRIVLAGFLALDVRAVELPRELLGVALDDGGDVPAVPLARVVTCYNDRPPVGFFDPDGDGHVLGGARGPRLRVAGQADVTLVPGHRFALGARAFRLVAREFTTSPGESTSDDGRFDQALRITARFDTVQIVADNDRGVTFDGKAARALTELAEIRQPVAWTEVAAHLWGELPEAIARNRWDQLMARVRDKLRNAGMRADLVRATGHGLVELVLGPHDKLQVKT